MTETILFDLLLRHFEAENWGQFLDDDEKAERPTSFNAQLSQNQNKFHEK